MEHSTLGVGAKEEAAQLLDPGRTDRVSRIDPHPPARARPAARILYPLLVSVKSLSQGHSESKC